MDKKVLYTASLERELNLFKVSISSVTPSEFVTVILGLKYWDKIAPSVVKTKDASSSFTGAEVISSPSVTLSPTAEPRELS